MLKLSFKSLLFIFAINIFLSKTTNINIFTPTTSFLWQDTNNWSLGIVPNASQDVVISPGSYVELLNNTVIIRVNSLNLTIGSTLSLFAEFVTKNTINSGTVLLFSNYHSDKITMNSGLFWFINNANLTINDSKLVLNYYDLIVASDTISHINVPVYLNGSIIIYENTTLHFYSIFSYNNSNINYYANKSLDTIGKIRSYNNADLYSNIRISCKKNNYINYSKCFEIVHAKNIYLYKNITIDCDYISQVKYNLPFSIFAC